MSDLPKQVEIHEEGPREGFQIEPGPISSEQKIRLIEALADTGLHHVQACSFVNPRLVPGWADAEAVVQGFRAKPDVHYTGLFFNGNGLDRSKHVRFCCRLSPEKVRVEITDEGPGFDPDRLPDPTDAVHLSRPGGRGVMLMRAFMSHVEFQNRGSHVVLEKERRG